VKVPWEVGRVLTPIEFNTYYKQVIRDCRHCSIRPKEHLPLIDFPLLMKPGEWPRLSKLTEKLSQEVAAAERELLQRPDLYESLGLPANIAKILRGCSSKCRPKGFARVMRFDFYLTEEGWMFSEANPDAAGGWIEAYGLTRAMAACYPGFSPPPNPAAAYAEAMRKFAGKGAMVGFFHVGVRAAAWCPEFILKEVEQRGMRGFLANPRRVVWNSNFAEVLTPSGIVRPNLLIRMLIANWLPRLRNRALWEPWFCGSKTPISNPACSVLVESKRLPLVYKELDTPMTLHRAYSPESQSPTEIPRRSQNEWVFKPAFGVGGQAIGIAGVNKKAAFKKIAEEARRNAVNWVAQRRFKSIPVPTERGPGHVCLGIYTVDGVAAGVFGRIRGKPLINHRAMSIPVLISQGDLEDGKVKEGGTVKNSTQDDLVNEYNRHQGNGGSCKMV